MADETAVLEAPEVEVQDDGQQEPTEVSDSGEQAESPEVREQEESQDEPAVIETDGKLKLSGKALATLNEIKKTDPKLARELRAGIFDAASLRKEFPGGIRDAVALKQEVEDIGGMDAVSGMRGELDAWKGLDSDWAGNKPEFAKEMAESNPEAFAFHAPHVMSKFAEVAPESYTYEVAKVFAQDMAANDVVMTARLLENVLFDEQGKVRQGLEAVARQWAPMAQYINRITNMAKTPPKAAEKQTARTETGGIDQREQAQTTREFGFDKDQVKTAITESEFKKNLGNRKLSSEKIATIGELYESSLDRLVRATPKHKETVDRYVAAKDRAGYRKYMDSVIRKNASGAMSAAFRRAGVGDKPGPKIAPKPIAAKTTAATNTTGFTRVGNKPSFNEVDWPSTNRLAGKKAGDGKYILRDSSRVLYQR